MWLQKPKYLRSRSRKSLQTLIIEKFSLIMLFKITLLLFYTMIYLIIIAIIKLVHDNNNKLHISRTLSWVLKLSQRNIVNQSKFRRYKPKTLLKLVTYGTYNLHLIKMYRFF